MSRYDPKNKEEALTYQLEDIVKTLRGLALCSCLGIEFDSQLELLKDHINNYQYFKSKKRQGL